MTHGWILDMDFGFYIRQGAPPPGLMLEYGPKRRMLYRKAQPRRVELVALT